MAKNHNKEPDNPYADFQRIDEGNDLFKQMFKYSVIPTIIHDMDMNIINVNDSAVDEFGYSRNELLNMSIYDLHTEEELDHSNQVLNEMERKNKLSVETFFKRKDGSVFMAEATPCKYLLGDRPIIHVFIQDITERKQNEKELTDSNRQLNAKNKELEQFAYIASHDLQEPLRTVNSLVDIFIEEYDGKLDQEANQILQFLSKASTHMSKLVQGLLEYSRIGRNQAKAIVNCNELVDSVLRDLSAIIKESGAQIEVDDLPEINGYKMDLRLLFQNLISNAIKFAKKNIPPEIKISATKENNHWKFAIQDNGIGIDEKFKDRIFVIFQRLHKEGEYEGSGIGLAHCYKIVQLHGGDIWVDSIPGEGSTFYFTIPE